MRVVELVSKLGDSLSWVTQEIIYKIAGLGLNITELQSKIFLIIMFGIIIYILLSFVTIVKKIIKFGLIGLTSLLGLSVAVSIFA